MLPYDYNTFEKDLKAPYSADPGTYSPLALVSAGGLRLTEDLYNLTLIRAPAAQVEIVETKDDMYMTDGGRVEFQLSDRYVFSFTN